MKKFLGLCVLFAAVLAGSLIEPATARAQEIQITGPLAGQPAVRRMRLYRRGRVVLEPNFSFTLQDEFQRTLIGGLHLGYYFTDWLGVGVWGGYGFASLDTDLTNQIESQGVTTDRNRLSLPSAQGFDKQVANMTWMAALQLEFIPLRGKLAIFEKLFVDTDLYIFLGLAFVGVEERSDVTTVAGMGGNITYCAVNDSACLIDSQDDRTSRMAIAPTFGIGLSMMFNDFIGLNLNWRGMPFSWNTSGTDESGDPHGNFPDGTIDSDDRFFKLQHMFQVGLMVYLPTAPEITD